MTNKKKTKLCPRCSKDLELEMFGINRSKALGLQVWCRQCISEHGKAATEANRAKWTNRSPYDQGE